MRRALLPPTLAWIAADFGHFLDHLRQDRELAAEVYAVGTSGYVATALLLGLVLAGSRFAPPVAAAFGASVVAGFALVHIVPDWSAISDPYSAFGADALSWALVVVPMLTAVWLVVAGLRTSAPVRAHRTTA